ncbi:MULTISPECIES: hypothetical protein [Halomicrobium]|uniref:Uncharacterized protein n=2 Tax=Halomicrobium mukohataei TaxID=57705 RepID=C7P2Z5_HALMD|nr:MULTISPECIES: hypothetical protein [Halomicrobium]ACV47467.1 hypothetical protein Hmuk_1346 [Halomicrobium mukohataei DSM 12286]QCD65931.1 hypothetical protein E5139_09890 [Halomicrobium mukohataei]QFR20736.1 hypothetical protein GBQ70_09885 [Halomicrobium sp. ZPS1]
MSTSLQLLQVGRIIDTAPGVVDWIVAIVLPIVAYATVGPKVGDRIAAVAARVDLDEAVLETPLGAVLREDEAIADALAGLTTYLLTLIALVISLSLVNAGQIASWAQIGARYLASLLGSVLILLAGFVVAGYVSRALKDNDVLAGRSVTPLVALVARGVVYFVSVTLALDAIGYNTVILNTMAQAVAVGLGLGIALAVGISVGLGSQDYVADHIAEWTSD